MFVNLFILTRTAVAERQIFKFCLHVVQAKAIGKRCIEIISLRGDLHLLVRAHAAERAHVMKTVGQLQQDGTDVKLYGREHLAEVVHLLRLLIFLLLLLSHDTDEESHVVAEALANLVYAVWAVFHNIVQECCHNRVCTQFQLFCQDACHSNRMTDIRLTRLAQLALMRKSSKVVGFVQ